MRQFIIAMLFLVVMPAVDLKAAELREFVLRDGSVLTGEILTFQNGVLSLRSSTLGDIDIKEANILTIRPYEGKQPVGERTPAPKSDNTSQLQALQQFMMSDTEIMDMIMSLQNDPDFLNILNDPGIMQAVASGDFAALAANPKFGKLLENQTVKEIGKKITQ